MADDFLNLAYNPKLPYAAMIFDTDLTCPSCQCEFVFIVRRELGRRVVLCQHCGLTFAEERQVA